MAEDILNVSQVSRRFGKKQVLSNVTFTADKGACVGIIGINGGGKSTLLTILAGVQKPSGGSFTCYGHAMFEEKNLFSELIAYLPQENPLLLDLSVRDNLRLWFGHTIQEDLPVLKTMQLLELLDRKAKDLSGGMKRRLAIACAVCKDQPVLIMDEPSSSLDLHQKEIIRNYIKEYTAGGGIVILSTHDIQEIEVCSQLYYLESGVTVPVTYQEAVDRLRGGVE